jgi:hypothetical protein
MTHAQMVAAFNEWMRLYTEDPASFEAEFQTAGDFLRQTAGGEQPSYGEECAAMLERLSANTAVVA